MALRLALGLALTTSGLAQQTAEENCAQTLAGGGWTLVRHVYNKWFAATDNLLGTAEYGTPSGPLSSNEWAIPFVAANETQFLFSDGDCDRWMVTTFDQFRYQKGSEYLATILESCISDAPYIVKWYNRPGASEDPWISYKNHWDESRGTNMYGENSNGYNPTYRDSHMNVWMRDDGTTLSPSGEPTKAPTADPTEVPTKMPSTDPTFEPTQDPTRDCSVFHIDEFLMDCSVEFDGHGVHIDTLKSDVSAMKDELAGDALDIAALQDTVSKLVNATAELESTMNAMNAEMQLIVEALDRMGDYP